MNGEGPLQLDIEKILKARISEKRQRFVPGFVYRLLARVIHQDELNEMLRSGYPETGSAFSEKILDFLKIKVEVEGMENLPPADKRCVFASNHPLGGLDGITLIYVLGKHYGDENIYFLVNDLLMNVEPLRPVFLPINKYGSQGRWAAKAINDAYASRKQMAIFPAGLVSRLKDGGEVSDLEWQKAFVAKAIEYGRDIVPIRFVALNRGRFYRLARLRKRLGIKVNLEQATLPAELCASRGKEFRIIIGKPIRCSELKGSGNPFPRIAARIREMVYRLRKPEKL